MSIQRTSHETTARCSQLQPVKLSTENCIESVEDTTETPVVSLATFNPLATRKMSTEDPTVVDDPLTNAHCVSPQQGNRSSASVCSLNRSDSSARNLSIYDQLSLSASSSVFASGHVATPKKFLQNTPPNAHRSEGLPIRQSRLVKENHQAHMLALAPIITDALVHTITSHAKQCLVYLHHTGAATPNSSVSGPALPGLVADSPIGPILNPADDEESDLTRSTLRSQKDFTQYETGGIEDGKTLFMYVRYLLVESWSSASSFVGAMILIDRFLGKFASVGFSLTYLNAFKVLVAASRVASKVVETVTCDNKAFAKAARLTVTSVNLIEQRFLSDMQFDVCILKRDWEVYAERILGAI